MEVSVFIDLHKKVNAIHVDTCPPSALSGILHGYLSVCSIVRVYPWLEEVYGTWWDNHLRVCEVARELSKLVQDDSLPLDERAGYVVDLMDAYQTYDDMPFLDLGLEAAYTLLSTEEVKGMIASRGTPNICRLLCCCFYFASDEKCVALAGEIVREWVEEGRKNGKCSRKKWQAILFYENVVSDSLDYYLSGEREQLEACNAQIENELIDLYVSKVREADVYLLASAFQLLTEQVFYNYDRVESFCF